MVNFAPLVSPNYNDDDNDWKAKTPVKANLNMPSWLKSTFILGLCILGNAFILHRSDKKIGGLICISSSALFLLVHYFFRNYY
jgi:hypothetical protein